MVRTGIDLGTESIKLVRGVGAQRLERVTHFGVVSCDSAGRGDDVTRAVGALQLLLAKLGLRKGALGHIAVAVHGEGASVREAVLPALTEAELLQALPYEARKHLDLEAIEIRVVELEVDYLFGHLEVGPLRFHVELEPNVRRNLIGFRRRCSLVA